MDSDIKLKHLAQAGYLGSEAQDEARRTNQPAIQHHGTETGLCPPSDLNFGRVTHTVYPVKYMVAVGDLSRGFQFYGPFTEDKSAARWAYNNLKRGTEYQVYSFFDVKDGA